MLWKDHESLTTGLCTTNLNIQLVTRGTIINHDQNTHTILLSHGIPTVKTLLISTATKDRPPNEVGASSAYLGLNVYQAEIC